MGLGLLTFAFVAVAPMGAQTYGADIQRWVDQDLLAPPEAGSVLFVGSSSVRRWEHPQRQFADYQVLQRGFGGSQFEQLNGFVGDIVLPYEPSAIVVWEGTNDVNSGETAAEVVGDYQQFVSTVHQAQPEVPIFYLGITPTPSNASRQATIDQINSQIASLASTDTRLHYIDLPTPFKALQQNDPAAFSSLYVDASHLTPQGYEQWAAIVRPALESVVQPNKSYTPNPHTLGINEQLLFDFGPSNPDDGQPTTVDPRTRNAWNSWHAANGGVYINAGEHIDNLVNTAGRNTGIDLIITGGFNTNGLQNGGLLNPDPALIGDLAVSSATSDYFFSNADGIASGANLDDDLPGGWMLTGLDPALEYELALLGTRLGSADRTTRYIVTGDGTWAESLQTTGTDIGTDGQYDGNDDEIALFSGLRSDTFGQLFLDVDLETGAFAYLNAMRLTAIPEPGTWLVLLGVGIFLGKPRRVVAERSIPPQ